MENSSSFRMELMSHFFTTFWMELEFEVFLFMDVFLEKREILCGFSNNVDFFWSSFV